MPKYAVCVVCGYGSFLTPKDGSRHFFSFPKSQEVAECWGDLLDLSNENIQRIRQLSEPKICSEHFDDDQFNRHDTRAYLKKNVSPRYKFNPETARSDMPVSLSSQPLEQPSTSEQTVTISTAQSRPSSDQASISHSSQPVEQPSTCMQTATIPELDFLNVRQKMIWCDLCGAKSADYEHYGVTFWPMPVAKAESWYKALGVDFTPAIRKRIENTRFPNICSLHFEGNQFIYGTSGSGHQLGLLPTALPRYYLQKRHKLDQIIRKNRRELKVRPPVGLYAEAPSFLVQNRIRIFPYSCHLKPQTKPSQIEVPVAKSSTKCVACGSTKKNSSEPLRFFSFPKSLEIAEQWATILGISQLRLHEILSRAYPKICGKHFDDDQFMRRGTKLFLHKYSLPTRRCYINPTVVVNESDSIAAAEAIAPDLSLAAPWASLAKPGWTGDTLPCPVCKQWYVPAKLKQHITGTSCNTGEKLHKCYFCGASCTGDDIGSHTFEQHEQIGPFGLNYSPEEQSQALIDIEGNVRQLEKWLCHLCGFMINGTRQQMHLHFTVHETTLNQ